MKDELSLFNIPFDMSAKNQEQICRTVTPVVIFWATMNVVQRTAGGVGYFSGRRGSILVGSAAVALGSVASHYVCTQMVYPSLPCFNDRTSNTWWAWFRSAEESKKRSDQPIITNDHTKGLAVCRTGLTVLIFSALNLNWCQTVSPCK